MRRNDTVGAQGAVEVPTKLPRLNGALRNSIKVPANRLTAMTRR
jgi:hypothetical protein